ncbi:MAG: hypothetical protein HYT11_02445, partial [Candidatus Levybacteria bacterium]|nr:hypothetical protein [Candidatus Levybacteria bacterium]
NIDEFIKSLKITVKIEQVNEYSIPRISQLTQKTNQFNMTTRRYLADTARTIADLESIAKIGHSQIAEALQYRPKQ